MRKLIYIILFNCLIFTNVSAKDVPIRRQALKTTFLSWYTGSCKLSYERAVFNSQAMEVTAGYIGFGYDNFKNQPEGFTVRYAHKFILYGNQVQPLNGFYLRPEIIYSYFHYGTKHDRERALSKMGCAVFTVGYQYVVNRFVTDFYFGGGYAFGAEADTHYQHGLALWDYLGKYNKNISMTFGVKIGLSF